ncbi:MAG: LicD family protein [Lachnospiraceae bacterium]|nr:LicD family protein [Lachnospiraceae bacterium]
MDFSVDFFRDEVRNGFYIPTAIKQGWAKSLEVLAAIDRVCEKNNITYFAEWGTILGAVRHGGFVPWDDDLDICMKREDYIRFREVADKELPEEFVIHDYERKEDHWLFLSRVVSQNQICFDEEHLKKYHNFPYMASVDIFVLDYLYKDETEERRRCDEVKRIIAVADGIVENTMYQLTIDRELNEIERKYNVKLDRRADARALGIALYKIAEKQMARVPKAQADTMGQIFPWILKGGVGQPKEYYEKFIRVPFENMTIPVPACYNSVLKRRYGNYLQIRKVWGGHDYPYFEKQRENLQAVADFKLPEFTFDKKMLSKCYNRAIAYDDAIGTGLDDKVVINCENFDDRLQASYQRFDSYKSTVLECLKQLTDMTNTLIMELSTGKSATGTNCYDNEHKASYENTLALLPECQQLAVDLGNFVEGVKGEERRSCQLVVEKIQVYCDALYEVYLILTETVQEDSVQTDVDEILSVGSIKKLSDKISQVDSKLADLTDTVNNQIINRDEILFLTIGPKEWTGFNAVYNKIISRDECDVYVVPLPLLFKDYFGRITADDEEIISATKLDEYPKDILLSLWTDYNIELHQPKKIYIQSPYDSENPCLTIPPQFYAENIRKYTDELIYIPPFKTAEFGSEDYTDIYNLKHYVTAPGVIYADKVIVQSENIKNQYVTKLTEFAGEETKTIWERKIITYLSTELAEKTDDTTIKSKKHMLYLIGLNELSEHKDNILEKIRNRMDIFRENSSSINLDIMLYPMNSDIWKQVDEQLTSELLKLIDGYVDSSWCKLYGFESKIKEKLSTSFNETLEETAVSYDAYYGSPSPFVTLFTYNKKPVMIAEYDI